MLRTRIGLVLTTAVFTVLGVLGTPAVAGAQPSPPAPGGGTATTEPGPGPSGGPNGNHHREGMLKDVLHGEGVVQTKKGPVRVALQRGAITSVTGSAATVKSADGWTRTWTLGNDVKVYEHGRALQPNALAAGNDVTVAGTISAGNSAQGGTYNAHWVRLHARDGMHQSPGEAP